MAESVYEFPKSSLSTHPIRLLHLLPAPDKFADLRAVLENADLDTSLLDYEALSYAWGQSISSRKLTDQYHRKP